MLKNPELPSVLQGRVFIGKTWGKGLGQHSCFLTALPLYLHCLIPPNYKLFESALWNLGKVWKPESHFFFSLEKEMGDTEVLLYLEGLPRSCSDSIAPKVSTHSSINLKARVQSLISVSHGQDACRDLQN